MIEEAIPATVYLFQTQITSELQLVSRKWLEFEKQ